MSVLQNWPLSYIVPYFVIFFIFVVDSRSEPGEETEWHIFPRETGDIWELSFLLFVAGARACLPLMCTLKSAVVCTITEPPRYTWRSTCRTFVYVTSVTWQAFTRRNYCVTHDCVTSMCVKCIWMTKVSKSWRNKTMTHINKTRITLTWRHKYINVTHVTPKNNYMTYDYMT